MESKPLLIQTMSQISLSASSLFIPLAVRDMGGAGVQVGLVVAGYNLAFLISNIISGRAADIYARRWIVRFGLLSSFLAFLFQFFVVYQDYGIIAFSLARFLGGMAAGLFPSALMAFVYERTGKVGIFASRGSLGWVIGMIAAGVIGYIGTVFLFATILFSAAFAVSMLLEPLGEKRMRIPFFPIGLLKRNRDVYGALLIRHTGASMVWVTFPLFMESLGANAFWIGVLFATNMATQAVWMQVMDRFDPGKLIPIGLVITSITFLAFTRASIWWHLIPIQIILGTSWATLYIGCLRTVMDRSHEKATSAGLVASTISMSGLLGPLAGGGLADIIGYSGVMYIASASAAAALTWFCLFRYTKSLC